jgi:RNA polymerase-binding transcription factor DksA
MRAHESITRWSACEGAYGTWIDCRRPIELHSLETAPEAGFCAACQCRVAKSRTFRLKKNSGRMSGRLMM